MNALIVTGERSAENYASILIDELNRLHTFTFFSICSNILDKQTIKVADYRDISIIGAKEAIPILKKAITMVKKVKDIIKEKSIDLIVLMDFPEFNLKIARFAKKLNKKVVYYITPQVWAWRKYRVKQLSKYTDLIIPILPFERLFFHLNKLKNAVFLGHPLVDVLHGKIETHKKEKIILIMPGSRKTEIEYNSKTMFEAARIIKENLKEDFSFVWIYPEHLPDELALKYLEDYDFIKIANDAHEFMDKAYFGILKSGTTTLEAAMFGLPMVVVYRMSPTSYKLGKLLIHNINFISLPNLILNREVVKELIQNKATPENISNEFFRLYYNSNEYNRVKQELKGIKNFLGEYPVSRKIARAIMEIL